MMKKPIQIISKFLLTGGGWCDKVLVLKRAKGDSMTTKAETAKVTKQTKAEFVEVYRFRNGFAKEAASMFGWLQHYNLSPSCGDCGVGESVILLPKNQVEFLQMMQKGNPARFGNYRDYN